MSGMIRWLNFMWLSCSHLIVVVSLLLGGCQNNGSSNIEQASNKSEPASSRHVEPQTLSNKLAFIKTGSQSDITPLDTATDKLHDLTQNQDLQIATVTKPKPAKVTDTDNRPVEPEPEKEPLQTPSQSEPAKNADTDSHPVGPKPDKEPLRVPSQSDPAKKANTDSHPAEPVSDKEPPQTPLPLIKKAIPTPKVQLTPPSFPKIMPNIIAPDKYQHPLQHANKIVFMLGEDAVGFYLYGEGPLLDGAYEKMQRYVNFYKKNGIKLNRLMLHSPGGLVKEGLLIGNFIRQNNWITDSDKYMRCYSSCGFIFASGVKKRIQQGAKIGFHRPYDPTRLDTPEFIEQVYNQYQPYWHYIHGDPALYDIFMKDYGRDDMYILHSKTISQYMNVEVY